METLEGTARTVGLFDIGTNSVRLSIVQVRGGVPVVVNQQREMVRLGEGEFRDGELQPESMDRCAAVCRRFRDLVRSYGDGEIVAVATSATRDAANQGRFLARLREEADLDVRVISGREEARLIYLGVVSGLHLGTSRALFVDIGGGSTELVVGTQTQHEYLDTLKLGAIRLSTLFQGADRRGPIPEETYQDMKRHVRDASVRSVQRIRALGVDRGFGSSGTLLNLGEICALRTGEPGRRIPLPCLREVLQDLRGLDLEGRRRFPGIQPERADILVGGGAIVETLLEELDLPALETSDRSLRDGLLADYLARTAPEAWGTGLSARERSVLQLGRTCHFDEPHARHIAERAGELFDTGREARLHDLGPRDRELLVYAALLHDIGMFLSFSNHHAHTHYLIRNAELLGFDQTEIQVMAATAFYHRKKLPRRKHPQFAELDEASRRKVRVLCLLLRLAESLDRSHSGVVRSARFREAGKRRVELELYASGECQLELWGLGGHQEDFREVFRKDLVLRAFPTLRRGISGESSDFRKGPQLG